LLFNLSNYFTAFFNTSSACLSTEFAVLHLLVLFTFLGTCITNVDTQAADLFYVTTIHQTLI